MFKASYLSNNDRNANPSTEYSYQSLDQNFNTINKTTDEPTSQSADNEQGTDKKRNEIFQLNNPLSTLKSNSNEEEEENHEEAKLTSLLKEHSPSEILAELLPICSDYTNETEEVWNENWILKEPNIISEAQCSVSMLVPAAKQSAKVLIGDKPADEISEFSEVGSFTPIEDPDLNDPSLFPTMNELLGMQVLTGSLDINDLAELIIPPPPLFVDIDSENCFNEKNNKGNRYFTENADLSKNDIETKSRRHSVIEFLAAVALGPVLKVCSPEIEEDLLKSVKIEGKVIMDPCDLKKSVQIQEADEAFEEVSEIDLPNFEQKVKYAQTLNEPENTAIEEAKTNSVVLLSHNNVGKSKKYIDFGNYVTSEGFKILPDNENTKNIDENKEVNNKYCDSENITPNEMENKIFREKINEVDIKGTESFKPEILETISVQKNLKQLEIDLEKLTTDDIIPCVTKSIHDEKIVIKRTDILSQNQESEKVLVSVSKNDEVENNNTQVLDSKLIKTLELEESMKGCISKSNHNDNEGNDENGSISKIVECEIDVPKKYNSIHANNKQVEMATTNEYNISSTIESVDTTLQTEKNEIILETEKILERDSKTIFEGNIITDSSGDNKEFYNIVENKTLETDESTECEFNIFHCVSQSIHDNARSNNETKTSICAKNKHIEIGNSQDNYEFDDNAGKNAHIETVSKLVSSEITVEKNYIKIVEENKDVENLPKKVRKPVSTDLISEKNNKTISDENEKIENAIPLKYVDETIKLLEQEELIIETNIIPCIPKLFNEKSEETNIVTKTVESELMLQKYEKKNEGNQAVEEENSHNENTKTIETSDITEIKKSDECIIQCASSSIDNTTGSTVDIDTKSKTVESDLVSETIDKTICDENEELEIAIPLKYDNEISKHLEEEELRIANNIIPCVSKLIKEESEETNIITKTVESESKLQKYETITEGIQAVEEENSHNENTQNIETSDIIETKRSEEGIKQCALSSSVNTIGSTVDIDTKSKRLESDLISETIDKTICDENEEVEIAIPLKYDNEISKHLEEEELRRENNVIPCVPKLIKEESEETNIITKTVESESKLQKYETITEGIQAVEEENSHNENTQNIETSDIIETKRREEGIKQCALSSSVNTIGITVDIDTKSKTLESDSISETIDKTICDENEEVEIAIPLKYDNEISKHLEEEELRRKNNVIPCVSKLIKKESEETNIITKTVESESKLQKYETITEGIQAVEEENSHDEITKIIETSDIIEIKRSDEGIIQCASSSTVNTVGSTVDIDTKSKTVESDLISETNEKKVFDENEEVGMAIPLKYENKISKHLEEEELRIENNIIPCVSKLIKEESEETNIITKTVESESKLQKYETITEGIQAVEEENSHDESTKIIETSDIIEIKKSDECIIQCASRSIDNTTGSTVDIDTKSKTVESDLVSETIDKTICDENEELEIAIPLKYDNEISKHLDEEELRIANNIIPCVSKLIKEESEETNIITKTVESESKLQKYETITEGIQAVEEENSQNENTQNKETSDIIETKRSEEGIKQCALSSSVNTIGSTVDIATKSKTLESDLISETIDKTICDENEEVEIAIPLKYDNEISKHLEEEELIIENNVIPCVSKLIKEESQETNIITKTVESESKLQKYETITEGIQAVEEENSHDESTKIIETSDIIEIKRSDEGIIQCASSSTVNTVGNTVDIDTKSKTVQSDLISETNEKKVFDENEEVGIAIPLKYDNKISKHLEKEELRRENNIIPCVSKLIIKESEETNIITKTVESESMLHKYEAITEGIQVVEKENSHNENTKNIETSDIKEIKRSEEGIIQCASSSIDNTTGSTVDIDTKSKTLESDLISEKNNKTMCDENEKDEIAPTLKYDNEISNLLEEVELRIANNIIPCVSKLIKEESEETNIITKTVESESKLQKYETITEGIQAVEEKNSHNESTKNIETTDIIEIKRSDEFIIQCASSSIVNTVGSTVDIDTKSKTVESDLISETNEKKIFDENEEVEIAIPLKYDNEISKHEEEELRKENNIIPCFSKLIIEESEETNIITKTVECESKLQKYETITEGIQAVEEENSHNKNTKNIETSDIKEIKRSDKGIIQCASSSIDNTTGNTVDIDTKSKTLESDLISETINKTICDQNEEVEIAVPLKYDNEISKHLEEGELRRENNIIPCVSKLVIKESGETNIITKTVESEIKLRKYEAITEGIQAVDEENSHNKNTNNIETSDIKEIKRSDKGIIQCASSSIDNTIGSTVDIHTTSKTVESNIISETTDKTICDENKEVEIAIPLKYDNEIRKHLEEEELRRENNIIPCVSKLIEQESEETNIITKTVESESMLHKYEAITEGIQVVEKENSHNENTKNIETSDIKEIKRSEEGIIQCASSSIDNTTGSTVNIDTASRKVKSDLISEKNNKTMCDENEKDEIAPTLKYDNEISNLLEEVELRIENNIIPCVSKLIKEESEETNIITKTVESESKLQKYETITEGIQAVEEKNSHNESTKNIETSDIIEIKRSEEFIIQCASRSIDNTTGSTVDIDTKSKTLESDLISETIDKTICDKNEEVEIAVPLKYDNEISKHLGEEELRRENNIIPCVSKLIIEESGETNIVTKTVESESKLQKYGTITEGIQAVEEENSHNKNTKNIETSDIKEIKRSDEGFIQCASSSIDNTTGSTVGIDTKSKTLESDLILETIDKTTCDENEEVGIAIPLKYDNKISKHLEEDELRRENNIIPCVSKLIIEESEETNIVTKTVESKSKLQKYEAITEGIQAVDEENSHNENNKYIETSDIIEIKRSDEGIIQCASSTSGSTIGSSVDIDTKAKIAASDLISEPNEKKIFDENEEVGIAIPLKYDNEISKHLEEEELRRENNIIPCVSKLIKEESEETNITKTVESESKLQKYETITEGIQAVEEENSHNESTKNIETSDIIEIKRSDEGIIQCASSSIVNTVGSTVDIDTKSKIVESDLISETNEKKIFDENEKVGIAIPLKYDYKISKHLEEEELRTENNIILCVSKLMKEESEETNILTKTVESESKLQKYEKITAGIQAVEEAHSHNENSKNIEPSDIIEIKRSEEGIIQCAPSSIDNTTGSTVDIDTMSKIVISGLIAEKNDKTICDENEEVEMEPPLKYDNEISKLSEEELRIENNIIFCVSKLIKEESEETNIITKQTEAITEGNQTVEEENSQNQNTKNIETSDIIEIKRSEECILQCASSSSVITDASKVGIDTASKTVKSDLILEKNDKTICDKNEEVGIAIKLKYDTEITELLEEEELRIENSVIPCVSQLIKEESEETNIITKTIESESMLQKYEAITEVNQAVEEENSQNQNTKNIETSDIIEIKRSEECILQCASSSSVITDASTVGIDTASKTVKSDLISEKNDKTICDKNEEVEIAITLKYDNEITELLEEEELRIENSVIPCVSQLIKEESEETNIITKTIESESMLWKYEAITEGIQAVENENSHKQSTQNIGTSDIIEIKRSEEDIIQNALCTIGNTTESTVNIDTSSKTVESGLISEKNDKTICDENGEVEIAILLKHDNKISKLLEEEELRRENNIIPCVSKLIKEETEETNIIPKTVESESMVQKHEAITEVNQAVEEENSQNQNTKNIETSDIIEIKRSEECILQCASSSSVITDASTVGIDTASKTVKSDLISEKNDKTICDKNEEVEIAITLKYDNEITELLEEEELRIENSVIPCVSQLIKEESEETNIITKTIESESMLWKYEAITEGIQAVENENSHKQSTQNIGTSDIIEIKRSEEDIIQNALCTIGNTTESTVDIDTASRKVESDLISEKNDKTISDGNEEVEIAPPLKYDNAISKLLEELRIENNIIPRVSKLIKEESEETNIIPKTVESESRLQKYEAITEGNQAVEEENSQNQNIKNMETSDIIEIKRSEECTIQCASSSRVNTNISTVNIDTSSKTVESGLISEKNDKTICDENAEVEIAILLKHDNEISKLLEEEELRRENNIIPCVCKLIKEETEETNIITKAVESESMVQKHEAITEGNQAVEKENSHKQNTQNIGTSDITEIKRSEEGIIQNALCTIGNTTESTVDIDTASRKVESDLISEKNDKTISDGNEEVENAIPLKYDNEISKLLEEEEKTNIIPNTVESESMLQKYEAISEGNQAVEEENSPNQNTKNMETSVIIEIKRSEECTIQCASSSRVDTNISTVNIDTASKTVESDLISEKSDKTICDENGELEIAIPLKHDNEISKLLEEEELRTENNIIFCVSELIKEDCEETSIITKTVESESILQKYETISQGNQAVENENSHKDRIENEENLEIIKIKGSEEGIQHCASSLTNHNIGRNAKIESVSKTIESELILENDKTICEEVKIANAQKCDSGLIQFIESEEKTCDPQSIQNDKEEEDEQEVRIKKIEFGLILLKDETVRKLNQEKAHSPKYYIKKNEIDELGEISSGEDIIIPCSSNLTQNIRRSSEKETLSKTDISEIILDKTLIERSLREENDIVPSVSQIIQDKKGENAEHDIEAKTVESENILKKDQTIINEGEKEVEIEINIEINENLELVKIMKCEDGMLPCVSNSIQNSAEGYGDAETSSKAESDIILQQNENTICEINKEIKIENPQISKPLKGENSMKEENDIKPNFSHLIQDGTEENEEDTTTTTTSDTTETINQTFHPDSETSIPENKQKENSVDLTNLTNCAPESLLKRLISAQRNDTAMITEILTEDAMLSKFSDEFKQKSFDESSTQLNIQSVPEKITNNENKPVVETDVRAKRPETLPLEMFPVQTASCSKTVTPTSFKFLQPKRKLIELNQIMSQETLDRIPLTSQKSVIEEEVVNSLPSVKALAQAFLLSSQIQKKPLHSSKLKMNTKCDNTEEKDESYSEADGPSSLVLTPGTIKDNINFFENLKDSIEEN